MGAGASQPSSDAERFRFSSLPTGLTVANNEAYLTMPDGSRRLVAVRGGASLVGGAFVQNGSLVVEWDAAGALQGGKHNVKSLQHYMQRETFDEMWLRMQADSPTGYRVPLPPEAYDDVYVYYATHPTAPYENVRGFAISLLPHYGERLPKALRLLMYQNEIGFFEYQAEIDYFQQLLAAAGRPEPFATFPNEAYARWEGLIRRANDIEMYLRMSGVELPPLI